MDLVKNREGFLVGSTHRECTNRECRQIFEKTSKTVTLCPACNTARVKSSNAKARMLNRAKQRSRTSGLDCAITVDDINIPEVCPALGIPLKCHEGDSGGRPNSPSLDRFDNARGYVPGNVRVLSHQANMMKSNATEEQLVKFARWVLEEYELSLEWKQKQLPST